MTPDKRKVLFVNDEDIFKAVSDMLLAMYPLRSIDENGCNGNNEGDGENSVFKSHTKNKLSKGTSAGDNGQSYSTQLTDFFKKRQPKEAHKQADDNKINDDRDETMDNYVIPSSPDNEDLVFDTTSTQRQLSGKRRRRQENNEINSNININNEENEEEEEEEDCYSPPTKKLPKNISFSSTSPTSSTKSINDKKDQQNKKKKPIERLGAINEDIPVSIEPDIISQAQLGITHASPRNSVIRIKHSAISLGDERYWVPTSAENAEIVGITKIGSLQKAFWTFLIFQDPSKPSQARLTQPQRSYSMQTTQQQQQQQQQQQSSLSSSSSSSSLSSLSTSSSSFPSSVDASPSRQSANASPRIFLLSWERAEEAIHIIQQVRRGVYPSDPVLGPPLRLTEVDISDSVAWRLLCQHSKRTTDALTLNSFKVVTDDSNQAAIKVVAVPRGIDHNDVAKEIKDVLKQLLRGTKLPICQYVGKAMLAKTPMKKLVGPPTPETGLALLRDIVSSRVSSCPHGKRVFQFLGNYQIK